MLLTLTNPTLADSYGNGISDAAEDWGHDDILDYVGIIVPGTNPPLDTRNSEAYSKVLIVVEFPLQRSRWSKLPNREFERS